MFSLTKVITMNLLWLDIQYDVFPSHQEVWEVQEFEEQSISGTGQQSTDNLIIFIQTVVFDGLKFSKKKNGFISLAMHLFGIALDIQIYLYSIL